MLPPEPAPAQPVEAPELAWWWRLEDAAGSVISADEFGDERFASQAEAESWVGEVFADLAAAGVDAVTLVEFDREVYGPMSLHA
ncbi:MAG: hypothetical protein ACI379_07410 [Nocardioides sp.]|uniref:hypothetical protein n=1 Tax=Nocardioides sp. TaxID=35761 RepID=UPI003EFE2633